MGCDRGAGRDRRLVDESLPLSLGPAAGDRPRLLEHGRADRAPDAPLPAADGYRLPRRPLPPVRSPRGRFPQLLPSPSRSAWSCWWRRWPAFGKAGCPSRAEERRNRGSIDLRRHGNVRRHGEPPSSPRRQNSSISSLRSPSPWQRPLLPRSNSHQSKECAHVHSQRTGCRRHRNFVRRRRACIRRKSDGRGRAHVPHRRTSSRTPSTPRTTPRWSPP